MGLIIIIVIYLFIEKNQDIHFLSIGTRGCVNLNQGLKMLNTLEEVLVTKNDQKANEIYIGGYTASHHNKCSCPHKCTLVEYFHNEYSKKNKKGISKQEISTVTKFLNNKSLVLSHIDDLYRICINKYSYIYIYI